MRVSTTMTRRVIVVPPELSLSEAFRIMQRERIRHLPVVKATKLLGILSDRDVLLHADEDEGGVRVRDMMVAEAMTPSPFVCHPESQVADLVRAMTERKIDALPVLDGADRLVGLVTTTDLLLLLIRQDEARPLPFTWELEEGTAE